MKTNPPKRALQFLRWFCREDFLEEFEGDLIEIFEEEYGQSPAKAKLKFSWTVVRLFRPAFIKSFRSYKPVNTLIMLKNDLKIAQRSLKKQPFFTFLNTFGLAIGMAGGLLISFFLYDELSFDKMFADADRIYRLNIDNRINGETNYYAAAPGPMAGTLKQDFPHVEMITRFRDTGSKLIRKPDTEQNVKEDYVVGADSSFFEMFGLHLLVGDKKTALKEANSLVLTRTAAEKHFGLNEALGQSLLLDNEETYVVTGVMNDLPKNSFLCNHSIFMSISSFEDEHSPAWNLWNFPTFVKLPPAANVEDLQAFLNSVKEKYLIPWAMTFVPGLTVESSKTSDEATGNFMRFNTTALTDIHLHSFDREGEFSPNSNIQNIYILSLIALFLLVLASVNFMNLSTAHALKRAKEVGIRKTLGSNRLGLIRQFLTEAGLISLLSLLLAVSLANGALPYFNELAGKSISIPFGQPGFWLVLVSAALLLGLFSGAYPAFFMSKFIPVKVLKAGGQNGVGGSTVRNSLVVFQFTISVFLIVSTLVVFQQLKFIQNKDLGFQKEQILVIDDVAAAGKQLASFKEEVHKLRQVKQVSLSSYLPTPSSRSGTTYFQEGGLSDSERALIIGDWEVDHDYVATLGLEIIAGRDFDRQFPTDSSGIILNESTVAMMGVEPTEVIGLRLTSDFHRPDKENMEYKTVIGVVKNFHFETLRNDIDAMSLILGSNANKLMVKLNPGDFSTNIAHIEKSWKALALGQLFNYYFMDDSFNETYRSEQRLGNIFFLFTILSIFIACLGLFGLAAFNAERRIKEMGIRKVLGASVGQITFKLSIDFLKLVGIAILIALPLGWFAMNKWLEDYSYRIEIAWWVFALAALMAIVVSILTLSYQSIKTALANPVESLRSE